MVIVSPSLLSADFLYLADEITMISESQCDWLHTDVMDGAPVPNFPFGFPIIKAIRPICQKPLDAHLMIIESWRLIDQSAKLGIHVMNVYYKVCPHPHRTLRVICEAGMRPAAMFNPHTPVELPTGIPCEVDTVLSMSVNPGYGGQKFIEHSVRKVERLRKMIQEQGLPTLIQVDGGVSPGTGRQLVEAGADSLVASSAVFKAPSSQEMIVQPHAL